MSKKADVCAIVAALFFPTLVTLVYFVWLTDFTTFKQVSYAVGKLLQFAFPLVWVFLIARQRPKWQQFAGRGMGVGIGFGLLVVGAMLGLYWGWLLPSGFFTAAIKEEIVDKIHGFGITHVWLYAALGVFYALIHSLLEEYYWRWFVFGQLQKHVALAPAILISSLGFMAHHVILLAVYFGWDSPATYLFSLAVAIGGGVWAWIYSRGNSLLGPWLSHLLVDAAIFIIGYDLARDLFS